MSPRFGSPLPSPARSVLAIGSGKGGVGKSTVSLNLALALADRGLEVGLLDADFYGPNIPLMVGLKRDHWAGEWTMASRGETAERTIPPMKRYGLKIMSAGFILAEDQPLILDGQTLPFLMRQLVQQVDWGDLDCMLVDLPPGTADVQQILLRLLPPSAAVLVVTPQDVAHLDARKAVQMFRRAEVPVLGAVENMSAFPCPHCQEPIEIFAPAPSARSIWALDVDRLGAIPLDPVVSRAGDGGGPLLRTAPHSTQAQAFRLVAEEVTRRLDPYEFHSNRANP